MKVNVEAPVDLPQGFILSVKVDGNSYNYKCDRDYKKGEKIQFDPDVDIITETEAMDEDPSEKVTNTTTTSSLQSSYNNAAPPTDILTIQQQKEQLQQQAQQQQVQPQPQAQAGNQHQQQQQYGSFQYELCGCCDSNVCCTALWWNSFMCWCIPLGQLLTRLNLNAAGQQIRQSHQQAGGSTTFGIIVTLCTILYACPILLALKKCETVTYYSYYYNYFYVVNVCSPTIGSAGQTIVSILYTAVGIYLLVVLTCTRIAFRRRFRIPGNGCCDCCTMYWCSCCANIQMLRQTHNETEYHYECCNTTGLPHDAPPLPPV